MYKRVEYVNTKLLILIRFAELSTLSLSLIVIDLILEGATNSTITSATRQQSLLTNTLNKSLNLSRIIIAEFLVAVCTITICVVSFKRDYLTLLMTSFQSWLVAAVCSRVCSTVSSRVCFTVRS